MNEEQVAEPVEPVTLEDLSAQLSLLSNALGVLMLVLGQVPIDREVMVNLVKKLGVVGFDEAQAFRPKSIVSPSILMPPGSH